MNLQRIQDQLMQRVCSVHHVAPKIRKCGNQLYIECCCEDFRSKVIREYESLTYKAIQEKVEKEMRKIFRGRKLKK